MLQVGSETAYNVQEAAQLLKVSAVTIRGYIHQGKLKAQRVGRAFYITEAVLEEFIRGGFNNGGAANGKL